MWIFVALTGYLFNAIASIMDKFLLHERISKPVVYAFYVSMFSAVVILYVPFGIYLGHFHFYGWELLALSLISGIIFEYALLAFYTAVQKSEISRVSPMVFGVVTPISLIVLSFFLLQETLSFWAYTAFICLVAAGFLVAFEFSSKRAKFFAGSRFAIISGVLSALSFVILKITFEHENFFSAFIWSRVGSLLGGGSFLLFAAFRKDIICTIINRHQQHDKKHSLFTGLYFLANKTIAGIAMLLINYAMSLGSVSLTQALGSTQFAFVLLLSAPLSLKYPKMFQEKTDFYSWAQKTVVVLLIALGLLFLSWAGKQVII